MDMHIIVPGVERQRGARYMLTPSSYITHAYTDLLKLDSQHSTKQRLTKEELQKRAEALHNGDFEQMKKLENERAFNPTPFKESTEGFDVIARHVKVYCYDQIALSQNYSKKYPFDWGIMVKNNGASSIVMPREIENYPK